MIDYFLTHLPQSLVVLGLIFLVIEVLVLGFSTFVLLFVGIGTIITGVLMALGLLPETLVNALLATAVISSLVALISWQPMKRMQNKVESHQVDNGMVGETFTLEEDLLLGKTVTHRYSGIDWKVKSKQPLMAGTEVKIVNMQVGVLTVEEA
ncbi:NfeD family protein [Psychromonas sp. B3M02]|uniref:NfeD family protein n=1 Tax=Psychromonas sp. B3M02 TaxID=2267226 RepID=UPI00215D6868|nr:NfeD family protein [Psychromonas sp. B3M02]